MKSKVGIQINAAKRESQLVKARKMKWVWIAGAWAIAIVCAYALVRRPHAAGPRVAVPQRAAAAVPHAVEHAVALASIAGKVTDVDARPIAEAHICAVPSSVTAASTVGICADADARGRYAIRGVPSGSYLVTAARVGFVTGSAHQGRPIELLDDTATTGVDIVLQAGGAKVTGFVVDATGGPVPHATVRGERVPPPRVAVDVEADDLGRFTLWFPPGPMVIGAQAVGYAPARWYGPAPSVNVRLMLTPGATVRGIVVASHSGEPLPAIEVRAVSTRNPASSLFRSSTTGAAGTFDIRGIEPGSYTLLATGDGWRGEMAQPIRLGVGTTVENVRIEVGPAAQVTGRVLVASAQLPCDQGTVVLGPLDRDERPPAPDQLPVRMHSRLSIARNIGASGIVHFPAVSPGHYSVDVMCLDNHLQDGPRTLDVESVPVSDLTWTVAPGLSISVLAVDDQDRPTPGVVVLLHFPGGPVLNGTTDGTGHYRFVGRLSEGTYQIGAQPPFEANLVRVELRDGDGPVTARVKIAGTASIVTTVHERGGSPVDGLSVTAVAQSNSGANADVATQPALPPGVNAFTATALGEGRYSIAPLKPGRYEVHADDGINATVRASYELVAGQALLATVEIDRGGQIRGHVVDDDGAPVPDVWVTASTPDPRRPPLLQKVLGGGRALTDQEGRFVVDGLAGGDTAYTVRVEQPEGGAAVKEGVKVGDPDVVMALRAAGTLAGTVVGDCGGADTPVKVQAVSLATGQASVQELPASGQPFRVSLAPGRVRLTAFCRDGHGMAQLTTELAPKEEVTGLRLALGPPGNLQGPP
jgi:hypothetical protein